MSLCVSIPLRLCLSLFLCLWHWLSPFLQTDFPSCTQASKQRRRLAAAAWCKQRKGDMDECWRQRGKWAEAAGIDAAKRPPFSLSLPSTYPAAADSSRAVQVSDAPFSVTPEQWQRMAHRVVEWDAAMAIQRFLRCHMAARALAKTRESAFIMCVSGCVAHADLIPLLLHLIPSASASFYSVLTATCAAASRRVGRKRFEDCGSCGGISSGGGFFWMLSKSASMSFKVRWSE